MAVKSSDSLCSAALQNERHVLDQLDACPQIVRCFGDGWTVENGREIYNLFLEYASRGSLADRVRNSGCGGLPESEIRLFTRTLLKGLSYIHDKGFSHCDIKLENILMFSNGDVKISDFGLAKITKRKQRNILEEEEGTDEARVEIRGTPLYMAPESVNDNVYDSPVDIWALGCSVVEMCSGKTAWSLEEGSGVISLLVRIGVGDELPRIPADLSEEGKDFLYKCFVKDPRERWTARMLLGHPFVGVDQDYEEGTVPLSCEEVSISPRSPFDFPEWVSVQSPVHDSVSPCPWVNYSPSKERINSLVTDQGPDWSISGDWVTIR